MKLPNFCKTCCFIILSLTIPSNCWKPWYHLTLEGKKKTPTLNFYSCKIDRSALFSIQQPVKAPSSSKYSIFLNILAGGKFPFWASTTFTTTQNHNHTKQVVFEGRNKIREYTFYNGKLTKDTLCKIVQHVNISEEYPQIEYGNWEWDSASIYGYVEKGILKNTTKIESRSGQVGTSGELVISTSYTHEIIDKDPCKFFHSDHVDSYQNLGRSHWIISVVAIIGTIFVGILLLLFKDLQPLDSRGAIPFAICCITLTLNIVSLIIHTAAGDFLFHSYYSISIALFAGHLDNTAGMLVPLIVFNYILVINIEAAKNFAYQNANMEQYKKTPYFKVAILSKYLKTWWFTFLTATFFMLLQSCIFVINMFWDDEKLMTNLSGVGFPLGLFGILLLLDLVLSKTEILRSIRALCGWEPKEIIKNWKIYFKKDIWWVRIEIIVYFLVAVAYAVGELVEDLRTKVIIGRFVISAYHWIAMTFALIPTIFLWIRSLSKKEIKAALLKSLDDSEERKLLSDLTRVEHSYQNFFCWSEIQRYKKEKNNRLEIAQGIHKDFLAGDLCLLQVNCPNTYGITVKKRLDKNEVPDDLLAQVEGAMLVCLSDPYRRLTSTSQYKLKKITGNNLGTPQPQGKTGSIVRLIKILKPSPSSDRGSTNSESLPKTKDTSPSVGGKRKLSIGLSNNSTGVPRKKELGKKNFGEITITEDC